MRSIIFLQHCEFSALVSMEGLMNLSFIYKMQLSLLCGVWGSGPVSRIEYKLVIEE